MVYQNDTILVSKINFNNLSFKSNLKLSNTLIIYQNTTKIIKPNYISFINQKPITIITISNNTN